MTYDEWIAWCEHMHLSPRAAAIRLGLGPNVPTSYKRGTRIPRYIALACMALAANLPPWPAKAA